MKDRWKIFDSNVPDGFVEGILEKTSGAVCESSETQLPEFVDGDLEETKKQLVSMHLEGCNECRALERSLGQLKIDLKSLGEIEPSPEFTGRVIAVTSDRTPVVQGLAAVWRRLLERPRFAFEFAYIGTVALVMVFWLVGGDNFRQVVAGLSRGVPEVSDEIVKNTTTETVRFTGEIKSKVQKSVTASVSSGQVLVDDNARVIVDRTSRLSEWTKEKIGGFAERMDRRRSNHD